jgi:eukaryotic-like serine/threonine-protein kinase
MYRYWKQIDKVIDKTLALEPELRVPFLEQTFCAKPEILEEAKEYLIFIEKAEKENFLQSDFLSKSVLAGEISSKISETEPISHIIGRQIGPYEIKRLLGEGGMGSVFLADRVDGEFSQQVAIKFIRSGFYSLHLRERFSREKQLLSKLHHPHIARLLDGGITDGGSPYLIMEYVGGVPVDIYCREKKLRLDDRLILFRQICQAVQFAHSKMIIHRDLKPDNIFVTGDGQIKIMDFGIGKSLRPNVDEHNTDFTRDGNIVASFDFAAPEQLKNDDISIQTDIYGLGALMYLLATDERVFVTKKRSIGEIENTIYNQAPVRPGLRSKPEIGLITNDLDAIILKTLRKEPENRYESAAHLIDDIERMKQGLPVLARKGSTVYKTKKFIFRNRTVLTTASIILIIAIGFLSYHLQTINRHVQQTEMEAETARSVTDFIVELFDVSNPIENEDGILTAAALLERGQNRFDNLDLNPEVQLELLSTLGNASMRLGKYVNAEEIYFKADSIASYNFPKNSYQTARAALDLGNNLTSHRKFFLAEEQLKKALPFFSAHKNQYWQDHSELLLWLGICLLNTDREEEARQAFSQALDTEQQFRPDSRQALKVQLHLAQANKALNHFENAEEIYLNLLDKIEMYGYSRYDIHRSVLNSLGNLHLSRGEYQTAYHYYNTALGEAVSIYGELHPKSLLLKHNLMFLFLYQKDFDRAIAAGHEMMTAKITRHGEHSTMTANGHSMMGLLYYVFRDYENAIHHFSLSHSIFEDLLGANHQWTTNQKFYLAFSMMSADCTRDGLEWFNAGVTILSSEGFIDDYFAFKNLEDFAVHFNENSTVDLDEKFEMIHQFTKVETLR